MSLRNLCLSIFAIILIFSHPSFTQIDTPIDYSKFQDSLACLPTIAGFPLSGAPMKIKAAPPVKSLGEIIEDIKEVMLWENLEKGKANDDERILSIIASSTIAYMTRGEYPYHPNSLWWEELPIEDKFELSQRGMVTTACAENALAFIDLIKKFGYDGTHLVVGYPYVDVNEAQHRLGHSVALVKGRFDTAEIWYVFDLLHAAVLMDATQNKPVDYRVAYAMLLQGNYQNLGFQQLTNQFGRRRVFYSITNGFPEYQRKMEEFLNLNNASWEEFCAGMNYALNNFFYPVDNQKTYSYANDMFCSYNRDYFMLYKEETIENWLHGSGNAAYINPYLDTIANTQLPSGNYFAREWINLFAIIDWINDPNLRMELEAIQKRATNH